jgi:hypothetical protein
VPPVKDPLPPLDEDAVLSVPWPADLKSYASLGTRSGCYPRATPFKKI